MANYSVDLADGGEAIIHNIYCIGRSYADHAAELQNAVPDEPVIFTKSTSALRRLQESGRIGFADETFHHEAELVLLIGKKVDHAATASWDAVSHLGLGLDLTRRAVQTKLKEKGLPWTRAKSFLGSAVVAPMLESKYFTNKSNIVFTFAVNGEARQRGETEMLLFPVEKILSALAELHPLEPGDLIFTGTPKGVGPIKLGDSFTLAFVGIDYRFSGIL